MRRRARSMREELGSGLRYTIMPRRPRRAAAASGDLRTERAPQRQKPDRRGLAQGAARSRRRAASRRLRANDWLQSTAPEIVAHGDTRRRRACQDHGERMRALEIVRARIHHRQESRCRLCLGAAGRAQARRRLHRACRPACRPRARHSALPRALSTASPMPRDLPAAQHVFVPHAWMQAWIDGRWQSFDAALAGFDAGHIAFSTGDGDPWRFYQGLDLLGRTELKHVESTGPFHARMKNVALSVADGLPVGAARRISTRHRSARLTSRHCHRGGSRRNQWHCGIPSSRAHRSGSITTRHGQPDSMPSTRRASATARLRIDGVRAVDWEDIASYELDGKAWLLIGDVGDNAASAARTTN